jgi:hypothetical protein
MESGDPYVIEPLNSVPQEFGGYRCLLSHRQISRARRDH